MGLRYDRDSARKNNGPTIYFTDATSLIMLTNEIRSTLENGLPMYVYRRPGEMMITFGASSKVAEGLETPGFVIARFLPDLPYLVIPYREEPGEKMAAASSNSFPAESTTEEDYRKEIDAIQDALRGNGGGKIIASRRIVEDGIVNIPATFLELCRLHPDAFVFCFHTPMTGCWIGASPELLLESRRGLMTAMALAGSRKAGTESSWDDKNVEEQSMVADFVHDTLQAHGMKIESESPFTKVAGKVEHICTMFSVEPSEPQTPSSLSSLLHDLSPTPALCGLPRETALRVIREQEKDSRGCYGGFCGPHRSPEDFTFFVNLRSACIDVDTKRFCIYAGGGITLKSDAGKEWEETELKATTISDSLCRRRNSTN